MPLRLSLASIVLLATTGHAGAGRGLDNVASFDVDADREIDIVDRHGQIDAIVPAT